MTLKEPESMSECVYFTNRLLDNEGQITAWVFRELCPKCNKSLMGKPKNPKTGKAKIRAEEYTCPYCKHEDETQVSFLRKKVQRFNEEKQKKESVEAVVFDCSKCKKRIEITKKMK